MEYFSKGPAISDDDHDCIYSDENGPNRVENYAQKKSAYKQAQEKIRICQNILDKDSAVPSLKSTIHFVAGSAKEPIQVIRIDGPIEISQLLSIFNTIKDVNNV